MLLPRIRAFGSLSHDDRHNSDVEMECCLVIVRHCRNYIFITKLQSGEVYTGGCIFISSTSLDNSLHCLLVTGEKKSKTTYLILTNLSGNASFFYASLYCLTSAHVRSEEIFFV